MERLNLVLRGKIGLQLLKLLNKNLMGKKEQKILTAILIGTSALLIIALVIRNKRKKIKCNDKVLFLGNSQTASSSSYVEKLIQQCSNSDFTKVAKVGAKSDWILDAYKKEIQNGKKYEWVSVMIGGNDIFARKSIDKTKENLEELFKLAKQNKSKILVMSSPTKEFYSKTQPIHLELAIELEEWLDKNKLVNKFIPLTQLTANQDLFASDNLHINKKGQTLVYNKIKDKAFNV